MGFFKVPRIKDIIKDPIRGTAALFTGGFSETALSAAGTVEEQATKGAKADAENLKNKMSDIDRASGLAADQKDEEDRKAQNAKDAAADKIRRSGNKGRASNLLTGGAGLSSSLDGNASITRRTLLGS